MTPGTLQKFCLAMMIIRTCVRSDDWLQMAYWKATDDQHAYEGPLRTNIYISKRSLERFLKYER